MQTQSKYGVRYLRYWFDEGSGKVFCLVEAPSKDAANAVHREAHTKDLSRAKMPVRLGGKFEVFGKRLHGKF